MPLYWPRIASPRPQNRPKGCATNPHRWKIANVRACVFAGIGAPFRGGGGNDDDGAITMTTQFQQFICAFGELTQCGRVELPHVVVAEPCRHRCSIIAPAHKPTHNTPHFGRPQLHTYYLSCNSGALDCTGWALLATVHDFALHSRSSRLVSLRPTAIATYSVCRHANASMRRPTQCCRRPQRTL